MCFTCVCESVSQCVGAYLTACVTQFVCLCVFTGRQTLGSSWLHQHRVVSDDLAQLAQAADLLEKVKVLIVDHIALSGETERHRKHVSHFRGRNQNADALNFP